MAYESNTVRKVAAFIPMTGKHYDDDREVTVRYTDTRILGNGSFGVVYQARLVDMNELVAIKKVLQDRRSNVCGITNRELLIMRRLEHPNIVRLMYYFFSKGDRPNEEFLNLILEYFPDTVFRVSRTYAKKQKPFPVFLVKLYMYQLFRALAYLHSLHICHRDVKPQNMLVHSDQGVLKLCDFGSAKYLIDGEPNVSYICSRYYRPPELIFGSQSYTTSVDVWSAGCVFGELLLGRPMFAGETAVDQLVEIIKVLGTPTSEQIIKLNPKYAQYKFPNVKSQPLNKYFDDRAPQEALELVGSLLEYGPCDRWGAWRACAHKFFDELRAVGCRLSKENELPPLFNFTKSELEIEPNLNSKLIPQHLLLDEFDRTVVEEYKNGVV